MATRIKAAVFPQFSRDDAVPSGSGFGGTGTGGLGRRSKHLVQAAVTETTADRGRRWFSSRTEEVAVHDGYWLRIDWRALLIWTVVITAISTLTILAEVR